MKKKYNYYNKYKDSGICVRCRKTAVEVGRVFCKPCVKLSTEANRVRHKFRKENNLCRHCATQTLGESLCPRCKVLSNIKQRNRGSVIKKEVFEAYGNICKCCGENETNMLQIDHISGIVEGHDNKTGKDFYLWLKKNKYPNDYQLLCGSCNWSKGLFGECPHQTNLRVNILDKCIQVGV